MAAQSQLPGRMVPELAVQEAKSILRLATVPMLLQDRQLPFLVAEVALLERVGR
jgi:hypothetical protein